MTEDKWEELWTRDVPMIERVDWLYEVKAEGDANKRKLSAIGFIMLDVCEDYGNTVCADGSCLGDPGWEGCLTRKILDVLEVET